MSRFQRLAATPEQRKEQIKEETAVTRGPTTGNI